MKRSFITKMPDKAGAFLQALEQDEQERNAFFHIQSSLSGSPENRPSYYRMERAGLQTLFGWKIAVEFFSRFV